jgi:hypothetical protein
MLKSDYENYWQAICNIYGIAKPFKTLLTSNKILTNVYFPEELISLFTHEAYCNEEEDITIYVSEQLLKLIYLSLILANKRGITLNELQNYDLAQMEQENI